GPGLELLPCDVVRRADARAIEDSMADRGAPEAGAQPIQPRPQSLPLSAPRRELCRPRTLQGRGPGATREGAVRLSVPFEGRGTGGRRRRGSVRLPLTVRGRRVAAKRVAGAACEGAVLH